LYHRLHETRSLLVCHQVIIQEDKRINIDGDKSRSIKSKSIESNTNKRKTRTTKRKEGCIGGKKDSSVLVGRRREKKRSLIIATPLHHETRRID